MQEINEVREQTAVEEVANAITHGIGAFLSIVALVILVVSASIYGNTWQIVSAAIYGFSMVFLYTMSTLYHSIRGGKFKDILNQFDHSAIFLLIAGTYTPITLVGLQGAWGWSIFGVIWALALAGIVCKVFFMEQTFKFSSFFYLAMGWMFLVAIKPMIDRLPSASLYWLLAGGFFYSVGVVFYLWRNKKFMHSVFHLFVLGGTVCHFFSIYGYIIANK
jgi:hemolysin III